MNLRGVTDTHVDSGVDAGRQIIEFTDALVAGDPMVIAAKRNALVAEVGDVTTAAAGAVVANFQMMNRILDAVGVPTPSARLEMAAELGVDPHTFGGAHDAFDV